MSLKGLFSTPLYNVSTEERVLAADITRICLEHETEEFRKPVSPQGRIPGVFESKFDFLNWDLAPVADLRRLITGHLSAVTAVVGDTQPEETQKYPFHYHAWFHVTRNGGYFRPHSHPLASWSAVFCADPGDTSGDGHNEGHLVVYDPRHNVSMYLDRSNRDMRREFSFASLKFKLSYGDLMIFPSYLMHFVEPYTGEKPRVTVAANFWINEFSNE
jgi:uncharacterized protein (TIGR02466 family)